MTQISDADMDNLRHMLGIGEHIKKRHWGYRNHFAPGGADIQSMERLEAAGLVRKGRVYEDTHYYHASEAGCVAAGLKPHQVRKAIKPIKKRIEDALTGSGGKLEYHALLYQVFPREEYPRAYRNSSNGGPPGCAMALGRALREMFNDHRIDDSLHDFGRTIRLRQFRSG